MDSPGKTSANEIAEAPKLHVADRVRLKTEKRILHFSYFRLFG
jgi:hypothetical protein